MNMDFSSVIGLSPAPDFMPPPPPSAMLENYSPAQPAPASEQDANLPMPLNMLAPRKLLEPYRNKALALLADARKITVESQDSQVAATKLASGIKKIIKTVEDTRKGYTDPFNEHIKSVIGLAKEVSAPLDEGFRHLTGQLNKYAAQVELERRKAEEEARRRAEEEQKRLNAEAKAAGVEAPIVPEVLPAKPESATVRTEGGTSFQRKTWTFSVEDVNKVPREFLELNESAVRAAIKNGVRNIDGLKIFETTGTVIR